jgi:hypothetical protein
LPFSTPTPYQCGNLYRLIAAAIQLSGLGPLSDLFKLMFMPLSSHRPLPLNP